MENNETYNWAPHDPGKKKNRPSIKKLGGKILLILLVMLIASSAMSCFYTVDDKQQAVVTTFGKVTDVTDAGVHFKLPFGIQKAQKVDVNVYQKIELGYTRDSPISYSLRIWVTSSFTCIWILLLPSVSTASTVEEPTTFRTWLWIRFRRICSGSLEAYRYATGSEILYSTKKSTLTIL